MNSLSLFENEMFGSVRTCVTENGDPYFCLADVCRILEIGNPSQVRTTLDEEGVIKVDLNQLYTNEGVKNNQLGNSIANFIDEGNLYDCVFRSRKPNAKEFKKWICRVVLPELRKRGHFSISRIKAPALSSAEDYAKAVVTVADFYKNVINASDASTVAYVNRNIAKIGLEEIPYVVSKGVTFSASKLLKDFNCNVSIYGFNDKMIEVGLLEVKTRPSTSSPTGVKSFKSLTKLGLKYGENQVPTKNEREVQPHYYEDKFGELLDRLGINWNK